MCITMAVMNLTFTASFLFSFRCQTPGFVPQTLIFMRRLIIFWKIFSPIIDVRVVCRVSSPVTMSFTQTDDDKLWRREGSCLCVDRWFSFWKTWWDRRRFHTTMCFWISECFCYNTSLIFKSASPQSWSLFFLYFITNLSGCATSYSYFLSKHIKRRDCYA